MAILYRERTFISMGMYANVVSAVARIVRRLMHAGKLNGESAGESKKMPEQAIRALIQTARQFHGVREEEGNLGIVPSFCNWWIGRDMRPFPMGMKGAPWCSTWVNTVGRLAMGADWPVPIGAAFSDVDKMVDWAKAKNCWYTEPEDGDLFCVRKGDGYGHIGIVTRVEALGQFRTQEGNTNDDGSFNGNGVYERVRETSQCGFIRWTEVMP